MEPFGPLARYIDRSKNGRQPGKAAFMKIKKLEGYEPKYPAKNQSAAKIGALAAAALIAAGSLTGCTPKYNGFLEMATPEPTEIMLEGDVAVDPSEIPFPEYGGEPIADSSEEDSCGTEAPELMGKIMPDPSGGK